MDDSELFFKLYPIILGSGKTFSKIDLNAAITDTVYIDTQQFSAETIGSSTECQDEPDCLISSYILSDPEKKVDTFGE
ncbi:MAG: hypothetical protein ACRDE7_14730 [Sphingobacterium sp.]